MIKVKADKIADLTATYNYKSTNHPDLGIVLMKDGLLFTSLGQFVGMAMPMPLITAKAIAELVNNDMLIEDTGLVVDNKAPTNPPQEAVKKKSILIGG